ncbi:MAG: FecR domain-containing protein, partial [Parabacteroides sp.]|nr:FecR domain-containing protein [Parabacteroides sp.]
MSVHQQDIVKKLLHDSLSGEEKDKLLSRGTIVSHFERQWNDNELPDFDSGQVDSGRIWKNIAGRLWGANKPVKNTALFYKIYSLAASFLLLIGAGLGWKLITEPPSSSPVIYIASSGLRSMQTIRLADGSTVNLGPDSRLMYPAAFTGARREVELDGQAFFEVAKDAGHPFVVKNNRMQITALGTAFEVFGYAKDEKAETVLLNGRIEVSVAGNPSGRNGISTLCLTPDKKLVLDKKSHEISVDTVDADKYTAWRKSGSLSFENENLEVI